MAISHLFLGVVALFFVNSTPLILYQEAIIVSNFLHFSIDFHPALFRELVAFFIDSLVYRLKSATSTHLI